MTRLKVENEINDILSSLDGIDDPKIYTASHLAEELGLVTKEEALLQKSRSLDQKERELLRKESFLADEQAKVRKKINELQNEISLIHSSFNNMIPGMALNMDVEDLRRKLSKLPFTVLAGLSEWLDHAKTEVQKEMTNRI
jgi:hypothetical protein